MPSHRADGNRGAEVPGSTCPNTLAILTVPPCFDYLYSLAPNAAACWPSINATNIHSPRSGAHRGHHRQRCNVIQVSGGCRDTGVAQLLADDSDIHPFRAKLGRMGMSEAMGVYSFQNARFLGKLRKPAPHKTINEGSASSRAEHDVTSIDAPSLSRDQPLLEHRDRTFVNASDSGLVAFAMHDPNCASFNIDVLGMQRQRLVDSQASAIQDRDQRTIPNRGHCVVAAGFHQRHDFCVGQHRGRESSSVLRRLRWRVRSRRVVVFPHSILPLHGSDSLCLESDTEPLPPVLASRKAIRRGCFEAGHHLTGVRAPTAGPLRLPWADTLLARIT